MNWCGRWKLLWKQNHPKRKDLSGRHNGLNFIYLFIYLFWGEGERGIAQFWGGAIRMVLIWWCLIKNVFADQWLGRDYAACSHVKFLFERFQLCFDFDLSDDIAGWIMHPVWVATILHCIFWGTLLMYEWSVTCLTATSMKQSFLLAPMQREVKWPDRMCEAFLKSCLIFLSEVFYSLFDE